MNLYKVSRRHEEYEAYHSFVVVAETEAEARLTHPEEAEGGWNQEFCHSWVNQEDVDTLTVELIGKIDAPKGVVHTHFYHA